MNTNSHTFKHCLSFSRSPNSHYDKNICCCTQTDIIFPFESEWGKKRSKELHRWWNSTFCLRTRGEESRAGVANRAQSKCKWVHNVIPWLLPPIFAATYSLCLLVSPFKTSRDIDGNTIKLENNDEWSSLWSEDPIETHQKIAYDSFFFLLLTHSQAHVT